MAELLVGNKEALITRISMADFSDTRTYELLATELEAISNGQTTSDILEITTWNKIPSLTRIISNVGDFSFNNERYTLVPDLNDDKYELFRKSYLSSFLLSARDYLNTLGETSKLRDLLREEKKALGFAKTLEEVSLICDIIEKSSQAGAIPKSGQVILQFPGTFFPFPHLGHLEVAQTALNIEEIGVDTRVLVTTFTYNTHRSEGSSTPFMQKLDMLRRGFACEKQVTIFGIEGDTNRQKVQMEAISQFSEDRKINYLCGSDTIIKKVKGAMAGNQDDKSLINPDVTFYVSVRKTDDIKSFDRVCRYLRSMGINTIILEEPQLGLSGIKIREQMLDDSSFDLFTNSFVEELFHSSVR